MMVSDAGYGLMMALLIPILIKIIKPSKGVRKLMWVLAMGGVFTVFWGAMYNTWFWLCAASFLAGPHEQLPAGDDGLHWHWRLAPCDGSWDWHLPEPQARKNRWMPCMTRSAG